MADPTIRVVFFDLGDTLVTSADRGWVPGAKALLAGLRALPLRLGIISNTGSLARADLAGLLPADFDWGAFDDALVILSSEAGVEKPDPAIFRRAVEKAGIDAGACLFCTEDLLDTLVAQEVGMRAARVTRPPSSDLGGLFDALTRAGLVPAAH